MPKLGAPSLPPSCLIRKPSRISCFCIKGVTTRTTSPHLVRRAGDQRRGAADLLFIYQRSHLLFYAAIIKCTPPAGLNVDPKR